jgi:nitrilase
LAKEQDSPFKVAAAQLSPVFMDRSATLEKACEAIREAGREGAKIVVFPEAFVPCYPDWVWPIPPSQEGQHRALYGEFLDQSVTIPGPDTEKIGRAAKAGGTFVVIGVNERNDGASGGSIYNTLLFFDDKGSLMGIHRKLVPTSAERLVWTPGDGSTLGVFDTPYGKLGGLICWENYMPLARYAMYAWGTQIYVAATWDSSDGWLATLQHIAREGRVAVIGCCIAMRTDQIPDSYEFKRAYPDGHEWVNRGASAIVGPDGHFLAEPAIREETIIYGEIDPASIRGSHYWMDAAGHYARPDVFQLRVNRAPAPMVQTVGDLLSVDGVKAAAPNRSRAKK